MVSTYNFEVALAFASLKTTESLAYARMIMDGTNPYEKFNWFKNFDPTNLPNGEEIDDLKNYDAALALATAGRMDEAYLVMKEVDIHEKLDPADFQKLDWSMDVKHLTDVMDADKEIKIKKIEVPIELEELIKKRNPNKPPGETLLEIYKDYEYVEKFAKRVVRAGENEKINISEAIDRFLEDINNNTAQLQRSNDEIRVLLKKMFRY